jgi:cytochrome d ubiquinol oxidase subunit I
MNARAEITDFWAMVYNPSSTDRMLHVWIGAFLAGAFLVLSINAWYIIKNRHLAIAKPAFKIALAVATFFSLAQLVVGSMSADGVAKNQPAKLAAMEGHYDTASKADMFIMGWVNKQKQETYGLKIPGGLSFLIHGDFNAPVKGLNSFKKDEQPPQVNAVFQFYHIMIAVGISMIALTLLACWYWKRGTLFNKKWLMWLFVWSVLLPQIANESGWFTAEIGRQPWVVYGLLRTSDALSKTVTANQVVFSLILFALVYALLLVLFLFLLNRKIQHGPETSMDDDDEMEAHTKRDNPILTH